MYFVYNNKKCLQALKQAFQILTTAHSRFYHPILQMRKTRLQEVLYFAKSLTAKRMKVT